MGGQEKYSGNLNEIVAINGHPISDLPSSKILYSFLLPGDLLWAISSRHVCRLAPIRNLFLLTPRGYTVVMSDNPRSR